MPRRRQGPTEAVQHGKFDRDAGENRRRSIAFSSLRAPGSGAARRERAEESEAYNCEAGIKPLIKIALGVQTFREELENATEFTTISYWESNGAMREFTGSHALEVFTTWSAIPNP